PHRAGGSPSTMTCHLVRRSSLPRAVGALEGRHGDKFGIQPLMAAELILWPKVLFHDQQKRDGDRFQRGMLSAEKLREVVAIEFRMFHDRPIRSFEPTIARVEPAEILDRYKRVLLAGTVFDDVAKLGTPGNLLEESPGALQPEKGEIGLEQSAQGR